MTMHDDFDAPWSLTFDRDGTEDIAYIHDARGQELLRSRRFWLPEEGDPVPTTLAAMVLARSAPDLLHALEAVIDYAENEAFSLEKLKDSPEAVEEAAEAWKAIDAARAVMVWATDTNPTKVSDEPYSVLLLYPDYAADGGTETYYALVQAPDPIQAIAKAQRQATAAQVGVKIEPGDFASLLVTRGHHVSQPLFDK